MTRKTGRARVRYRLLFWGISGLLLISVFACSSVGVYDPQATQVALQGTVSALQETVTALETASTTGQAQPVPQPSPQIIVVTATPTHTAIPSPTPLPTQTPSPSPTVPPTSSSKGETIIIVVTPTPTITSTPNTYDNAPIITEPRAGTVVEEGREILLRWSWNGLLGPNEHFDVKVRPDGQSRSAYVAWEEAEAHDFKANLSPGRYFWSVQVIKGYYRNDSGEPEDRVFEAYLSPESEPRLIIVGKKPRDHPRSVSQAEPPIPTMPYGLALGGIAFVAFLGLTHKRGLFNS